MSDQKKKLIDRIKMRIWMKKSKYESCMTLSDTMGSDGMKISFFYVAPFYSFFFALKPKVKKLYISYIPIDF